MLHPWSSDQVGSDSLLGDTYAANEVVFCFFLPSILRCVSNTGIYFSYGYIPGLPNLFLKLTWELGKQKKTHVHSLFPKTVEHTFCSLWLLLHPGGELSRP